MARSDFDRFVQRKKNEESLSTANERKQRLDEWREYLEILYADVKKYLDPYIKGGTAKIEYHSIDLNEEFSGPYTVQQLLIRFGISTIVFRPIGTMLIGSKGRVDVHGPRGIVRLSLIDKHVTQASQLIQIRVMSSVQPDLPPEPAKIEWVWKISSPPPQMTFTDLTEDSFFDLILSVADA
jgi:hypothetical protein